MPIYEYLCEKCEHEFEREQRITADPIKTCPECKSRRVKKLISQTSFVLKGGGWYNDLYSSTKKEEKKSDSDSSGSKSSDSKPKSGAKKDGGEKKSGKKKSSKSAA
jgi:putative FmdB family regulatory protein